MFRLLVGRKGLRNVILASTKASEVSTQAEADHRHHQLETIYWKDMIKQGSSVRKYNGRLSSAESMIQDIMRNHPETLRIQRELVKEGKDLLQTDAGACINAEVLEERRKAEEEMRQRAQEYEEEQRQMRQEHETEKQAAEREQARLMKEHDKARKQDKLIYAELLEKQMIKDREASEERERQWQIEQEEIRRQNAEELRQCEAVRRAAEEKSRRDEEALLRYQEEVAQNRENFHNFAQGKGADPSDVFFAWASGFVVASTFFFV